MKVEYSINIAYLLEAKSWSAVRQNGCSCSCEEERGCHVILAIFSSQNRNDNVSRHCAGEEEAYHMWWVLRILFVLMSFCYSKYILEIHHSETLTAKYIKSTPSKSNHVAVTAPLCKPAFPAKMKYLPEREGKGEKDACNRRDSAKRHQENAPQIREHSCRDFEKTDHFILPYSFYLEYIFLSLKLYNIWC